MFRPLDSLDLSRQPLVAPSALVTISRSHTMAYRNIYVLSTVVVGTKPIQTNRVLFVQ